jgi:predicted RNase H-like nuclease (RuvC/YqgF family)
MISAVIDDKYWEDTIRAIKYRRDLRYAIDKQTKKINNELRKRQLKYLKSLI